MLIDWQLASGSILGRQHRIAGRNNQDALCVVSDEENLIAIVCDGCGSGAHSEVGAQVGARMIAHGLLSHPKQKAELTCLDAALEQVRCDTLTRLGVLAGTLGPSLSTTVRDYLLFTVVGAWLTPREALFFALGDGALWVNGEAFTLGPFPGNAPPYLAYSLVDTPFAATDLRFTVLRRVPLSELQSFLVGTDGVCDLSRALTRHLAPESGHPERTVSERIGSRPARRRADPLSTFWQTERFFANPDSVRRTLANLNRDRAVEVGGIMRHQAGLLPDDTTLIVGRRAPATQGGERR